MGRAVFTISFVCISRATTIFAAFVTAAGLFSIAPYCVSQSFAETAFPLKVSKSGRYLVDQNNVPFLIVGDSPHAIIGNISEAEAEQYFSDRALHGFNAVWIEILCNSYCGCSADGSTRDGIPPLLKTNDLSTPNPAYFHKVDNIIRLAARHGLVVFLDSIDTAGWLNALRASGRSKDYNFGLYLGTRYKNFQNIIWITGNDFQTWRSQPSDNSDVEAVMQGIAASDPNHLQTSELDFNESGSLDDALLAPYTSLAAAYSYYPTYREIYAQYQASDGRKPVFMEEGYYDGGTYPGHEPEVATNLMLRKQAYWTILAGGLGGYIYGTGYYDFHAGWEHGIDTAGAMQIGHWKSFFTSIPWYDLSPDQSHTFVTAGYGTESRVPNFIQRHLLSMTRGNIQTDDYVTAALTPNGEIGVAYLPEHTTVTVNMTVFPASVSARWFDPAAGKYREIAASPFPNTGTRQFTPPEKNNEGDPDWVLLLRSLS